MATLAQNGLQQTPAKAMAMRSTGMRLATPAQPHFDKMAAIASTTTATTTTGVMSPVNQDGCFEFDRIIKAGTVVKRTRKTKSWKPIYVVLRPNCLSIYRDKDETKLRHQINLSEITAVARQRDSKKKMDHVFAIFSPARNYHLGASSDKEAQDWVDLIRTEARIDEDEGEPQLMSPVSGSKSKTFAGLNRSAMENIASSSSEAEPRPSSSMAPENMHSARRPSQALNYSGNERGSISDFDFSDTGFQGSANSLPPKSSQQKRNVSQQSNIDSTPDDERVVYHGWLYVLKSKRGVRQWKKVWLVLRPKCLAFYKNDQEYSASLIIPFSSIIDAVDIDSVSRSKQYCMQVISDEKNFKFCAADENALAKCLGAFKSLLAKKKDAGQKRVLQTAPDTGNGQPTQQQPAVPSSTTTSAPA
ncbi:PH domain-like protein [Cucurbitaria berberidis CBS 394.84]|uniref:PH domain-like protein n=1 Tax=Cucurbitaria berberidis CBS 394.84 TaxID=1168544 RepID=A0A9P4LA43_9PLEO|nr:PH domain-like protein [Cucurbitaria berberidis CBS 394.84]KAF1847028.1 PH domain-like protein [Cucurbitaria berberidis CBS 394.84]